MELSISTHTVTSRYHSPWTWTPVFPLQCRLLSEETETFCCREGKVAITPLRPLPEGWERMFRTPTFKYVWDECHTYTYLFLMIPEIWCSTEYFHKYYVQYDDSWTLIALSLRGQSRKYNNLFAFTAMGVTGTERFVPQPVPSCVKIHGRTYHRVLPADMQGPVHW